jgi:hypothetical protein
LQESPARHSRCTDGCIDHTTDHPSGWTETVARDERHVFARVTRSGSRPGPQGSGRVPQGRVIRSARTGSETRQASRQRQARAGRSTRFDGTRGESPHDSGNRTMTERIHRSDRAHAHGTAHLGTSQDDPAGGVRLRVWRSKCICAWPMANYLCTEYTWNVYG